MFHVKQLRKIPQKSSRHLVLIYIAGKLLRKKYKINQKEKIIMLTRRFETTPAQGWLLYNNNDLLYGLIQYLATYNPKEEDINHRLYLTKVNLTKNKKLIMSLCGFNNAKTYGRHLQRLIDNNLLEEFTLELDGHSYPSYGVVVNYNANYKVIDRDWLYYLIGTRSNQALKVYFFLLDRYEWKLKEDDYYVFTNKEIKTFLGYAGSSNQNVGILINNILDSFQREGIIKIEEFYDECISDEGNVTPTPRKRILFVARSEEERSAGHPVEIKKEIPKAVKVETPILEQNTGANGGFNF